jgi:hypothetical protein
MGKSSHRHLQMLKPEQLQKLTTPRLLGVLKRARAVEHAERRSLMMPHVCCEVCMEWMLDSEDFDRLVVKPTAHLTGYKNRIKAILATREHID